MAKEKKKLDEMETEKLKKQVKTCKILRLVFIIGGALFVVGGGFLFFLGLAYLYGGVLAIVFTGGHADISELAATGYAVMLIGIVVNLIGLGAVIAGPIVTSVKIKHRRAILADRGEF